MCQVFVGIFPVFLYGSSFRFKHTLLVSYVTFFDTVFDTRTLSVFNPHVNMKKRKNTGLLSAEGRFFPGTERPAQLSKGRTRSVAPKEAQISRQRSCSSGVVTTSTTVITTLGTNAVHSFVKRSMAS